MDFVNEKLDKVEDRSDNETSSVNNSKTTHVVEDVTNCVSKSADYSSKVTPFVIATNDCSKQPSAAGVGSIGINFDSQVLGFSLISRFILNLFFHIFE